MTQHAKVVRSVGIVALLALAVSAPPHAQAQEATPKTYPLYLIGLGDVVSVSVWKNAELSATVPVRPDGRISVPLIGEIDVAGRTTDEVRRDLIRAFEQYVTAPAVTLTVDEILSRRVFVIGEVGASGVYDIFQPTKLMQALAMAGGLSEYAKKDRVIILRDRGGNDQRLVVSIKAIETGKNADDNILLQPGDTIIVP